MKLNSHNAVREFELRGRGISERHRYELARLLNVEIEDLMTPGDGYKKKVHESLDIVHK